MPDVTWPQIVLAFSVALVAGAINSIAGGGTILTFPVILAVLGDSKMANITSTLGLWPASLGGAWGYRREIEPYFKHFLPFFIISFFGGGAGAALLLWTKKSTFDAIVPLLILGATSLFMVQSWVSAWLRRKIESGPPPTSTFTPPPQKHWLLMVLFQWVVAVYGGYFGAGIGIMMLAALGLLGLNDIYQMNGIKNVGALCINGLALICFILWDLTQEQHFIVWPVVAAMAAGGILGGYFCVGLAKKVGPTAARWIIITVGWLGAAYTAWKAWF